VPREEQERLVTSRDWKKYPSLQRQFCFADSIFLTPEARSFWQTPTGARQMSCNWPTIINKVGNLSIRCFPVDHSIYGATAFTVETSQGWVVYTGDLRMHGKMGYKTRQFADEAAKLHPSILLCEGTNINKEDDSTTEEDVMQNTFRMVKEAKGKLVIADFGPRNLERLLTFRAIASECQRKLAILLKDAYLLQSLHLVMPEIPDPIEDDTLTIYEEIKSWLSWERDLLARYKNQGKTVQPEDIRRDEGNYILCLSFWDVNELIDIKPSKGGIYIYSSSEAFSEEQRFDVKRLRQWLHHFDFLPIGVPNTETGKVAEEEQGFHSSGHASASELLEVIETIGAKLVIPIHTEHPELFLAKVGTGTRVHTPKIGQTISI